MLCCVFSIYEKSEDYGIVLIPPIDLDKWKSKLGGNFVLLFRAHYEVSKTMDIQENDFVFACDFNEVSFMEIPYGLINDIEPLNFIKIL